MLNLMTHKDEGFEQTRMQQVEVDESRRWKDLSKSSCHTVHVNQRKDEDFQQKRTE